MGTEKEIKLILDKKQLQGIWRQELIVTRLQKGSRKTLNIENYYYDTADFALRQAGFAYRVRKTGRSYEATIKTGGSAAGGFSTRGEYTVPLRRLLPATAGFGEKIDSRLAELLEGEKLQQLFAVIVERNLGKLQLSKDTVVELAVDEGEIRAAGKTEPVAEVEMELMEGDEKDLLDFVALLSAKIPLFVENRSKYARGIALLLGKAEESEFSIGLAKSGNAEIELKNLIYAYCDRLLVLQNEVKSREGLRVAYEEILLTVKKLLAVLHLVEPLFPEAGNSKYVELLTPVMEELAEYYIFLRLLKQWQKIYAVSKEEAFSNSLKIKLAEQEKLLEDKIIHRIKKGELSHGIFVIWAGILRSSWQGGRYMRLDQFVEKRFAEYSEKIAAVAIDTLPRAKAEALSLLELVEKEYFLIDVLKTGGLGKKKVAALKDTYKSCLELVTDAYRLENLEAFRALEKDKTISRDIGILLGYRLSILPKKWKKAIKNWQKSL